ncbi:MAG: hypothetical protein HZA22_13185 [Nitrospirae bacterium]|nr:hypothetical protein [Nitrospirota bacterium]MBI5696823.1 hypothetical protein [Nitrospirota bacterium]
MTRIIIIAIVSYVAAGIGLKSYRVYKANKLLGQLSYKDWTWDSERLKKRAEDVRAKVIGAIIARNVDRVKDLITDGLYNRLINRTAEEIGFRINNPFCIVLSTSIKFVEVTDYKDKSKDSLGVYVTFFSISFVRGYNVHPPDELWTFVRRGNEWVVDDIDPDADLLDLVRKRTFSEELAQ